MKLTLQQVQILQKIAKKGFACKRTASSWTKRFCEHCGIGFIDAGKWVVTDRDIPKIERYLENQAYGSKLIDGQVRRSRIETSDFFDDEKQAKPITHNRLFTLALSPIQMDGQTMPTNRAFDASISEIVSSKVSQILIIENLEVFFEVFRYEAITNLLNSDCLVIYRGDRCYSTRAVNELLNLYDGEVVGFLDFDPASLSGLGIKNLQKIILPTVEEIKINGQTLNQEGLFTDQITNYYASLLSLVQEQTAPVATLADIMLSSHIAVTQERLLARKIDLIMVDWIRGFD